jgi:hypothetical protein
MLTVLQKVFKDKVATPAWQEKLHQIVPSYGTKLNDSPEAVAKEWAYTANILQLTPPPAIPQLAAPKPSRLPSLRPSRASRSLTWRCKQSRKNKPAEPVTVRGLLSRHLKREAFFQLLMQAQCQVVCAYRTANRDGGVAAPLAAPGISTVRSGVTRLSSIMPTARPQLIAASTAVELALSSNTR